jgi:hypothetical protein
MGEFHEVLCLENNVLCIFCFLVFTTFVRDLEIFNSWSVQKEIAGAFGGYIKRGTSLTQQEIRL